MSAPTLPPLRDVIAAHGLRARKALGQNFLLDLNLTRRIVRAAGPLDGFDVVEIGPGPGGLTRALLESDARRVISIERDDRCIQALQGLRDIYQDRFHLIDGDALKTDVTLISNPPRKIIANLPYNIATPLLTGWLEQLDRIKGMTLMFQREVADRIAAKHGTKAYGRLSIICQWLCETTLAFNVDKRAFTPPPKVTSAVVTLKPRENPVGGFSVKTLERVTAAAFGQRRKMLRASLKTLQLGTELEPMLESIGIDPTARSEDISVEAYCRLSQMLEQKGQ